MNGKNALLKTAVVYGANASGKTKLFEAFDFLKSFVCPPLHDVNIPVLDFWQKKYDAFRLNTDSKEHSSFFEAIFMIDQVQYRYGIELNDKEVLSEWLYMKKLREINVFSREKGADIKYNKEQLNTKVVETILSANMVSPTACFLTVLKTFNEPLSKKIADWFECSVVISANDINAGKSLKYLLDEDKKRQVLSFMKSFDINIEDMSPHEARAEDVPEKIKAMTGDNKFSRGIYDGVKTAHKRYNSLYERVDDVWFSLEKDKSFGTNRLFWLSWAIINALQEGSVLFIDEFDSGIHPYVAMKVIELFYKCHSNAQLIINTHNSSMLKYKNEDDQKLFIKNQVFVVDKNRYGESSLIPLTDFSGDFRSNLETLYLDGEFGGVPYINTNSLLDLISVKK